MSHCRTITLARNGVAHVQACRDCGCISLHIGPTTLRIEGQALERLWTVLGEAHVAMLAERLVPGQERIHA